MAFNPFNLFKGNPKVMELMTNERGLDQLLLEEAFVSEFKKTENEALQSYMTYERYAELVNFITVIDSSEDKNRAYKFPYVASEVLAVNNDLTYKFLLEEVVFTEEQIEEETEIEKEIDSESSDRSYSSIKSNNSNTPKKEPSESRPYLQADKENFILREDGDKTLSEMDFKDITEDDFPQVKQKRVVLVRQKVKRTVKRPYQPLVFRLLDFFSKQVVHILDGYVCRVLDSIINNRLQAFLAIIEKYSAFNQLKRIFSHLQSNSVQDFLLNFISKLQEGSNGLSLAEELKFIEFVQTICQISPKEWPKQEAVLDEKAYILTLYCSILQKINTKISSKLDEKKEQTLDMAAELGEVGKILRKEHISRLIQIVKAISSPQLDRSPLLSRICLLYARLLKLILKGYSLLRAAEVRKAGNLQVMREMVQGCQECFDPIIPACFTFTFEDSLQAELPYKGRNSLMNKMQLLQVLGILAKENIYFSRRSMLDQPQFGHLLTLMDLHPNSSILHNAVLAILIPFFHSSSQPLLEKLFRNQNLFSQLFQVVKSDSEVRYQKKGKRKCFMAQITALCLAIDRLPAEDSQTLSEYKQSYEWQFIRECLIEDEQGLRKKVLGGHEKLRDRKPLIFFTKQQCLDHFRHFLAGVKLNLFDDFENYDPGNSDSEDQKQRQQRQREEIPFSSEHYEAQIDISPPQDDTKYFAEDVIL